MYPVVRYIKEIMLHAKPGTLALGEIHHTRHICWPWDVDLWRELNNGRTLTLYDLGRVPMMIRLGLIPALRENGWNMAVAGSSVRYRRRVRMFQRISMQTMLLGWDARFFYVQQSMWRKGEATSSILARMAISDAKGIAAPHRMAHAIGWQDTSPDLPEYVLAWIAAEDQRPWPPAI